MHHSALLVAGLLATSAIAQPFGRPPNGATPTMPSGVSTDALPSGAPSGLPNGPPNGFPNGRPNGKPSGKPTDLTGSPDGHKPDGFVPSGNWGNKDLTTDNHEPPNGRPRFPGRPGRPGGPGNPSGPGEPDGKPDSSDPSSSTDDSSTSTPTSDDSSSSSDDSSSSSDDSTSSSDDSSSSSDDSSSSSDDSSSTSDDSTSSPPSKRATSSSGSLASTYKDIVLAHHNFHRDNHSAPHLTWDTGLESTAKKIANTCNYGHSMNVDGGGYGQNIAAGVAPNKISQVITDMFYNGEVNAYNGDMSTFENWGHFSQVVWKATTKVACATADCSGKGLQNTGSGTAPYFTVCNYKSAGNFAGQYEANIGKSLNKKTITWSEGLSQAAIAGTAF